MSVFNVPRDEREELRRELEQELHWIQYRQKMLDIIEDKLFQMRELAEKAKEANLSRKELKDINVAIHNLEEQVKALDSESRNSEDDKIL
jgi:hypothetical protein